ncbi:UbiA family prenyltransferase [Acidimangrovimonas pyrenivorans]|uniref:UbiA family prenyltransferase n=1 Tax=Acidimangrovimonas pyrenivorans TaxID=2030798 RepID=A0ABV7ACR8_9RHOB
MADGSVDQAEILAVDLDGTLLRSNALHESVWGLLSHNALKVPAALAAGRHGRAALKRAFARPEALDVATLPYDPEVIAYIRAWRDRGGRTALVTATDETIARRIADHLGIFDEVHGSDGTTNLKGAAKAALLSRAYGAGNYAYLGDAAADLPAWQGAARAITVNAAPGLREQAAAAAPEAEHLTTRGQDWRPYLTAARPHQWLKNILIFVPAITAHRLDPGVLALSLTAFVAFALVASSVYVLNDLLDLAADRAHPRKRTRPFASGAVPLAHGTVMAPLLLAAGLCVALALGGQFLAVMLAYYLLTLLYSLALKRQVILDVCALACLYTLRIAAGAAATGLALSVWLIAFSLFFFFALAVLKRQAELVDSARHGKLDDVGRGYLVKDLPILPVMALGAGYVSVLVMALYVNSPEVAALYRAPAALWGICLVLLYWITRMEMVTHRGGMADDPMLYALRDRVSLVCGAAVLALILAGAML